MRKICLWTLMVVGSVLGLQAQGLAYYYKGEPRPLTLHTSHLYLLMEAGYDQKDVAGLIQDAKIITWGEHTVAASYRAVEGVEALPSGRHFVEVELNNPPTEAGYMDLISRLKRNPKVVMASPFFTEPGSKRIGMSELFRVKLNSPLELTGLKKMAQATKTRIVGQDIFMENWYTLACDKNSMGNALEMANHFYLQGKFAVGEPDLIPTDIVSCVNDPLFPNQWALNNTGQYGGIPGIDLNACVGWANWTTGNASVRIGILDQGYELNHPDLAANNFGLGFDCHSLGNSVVHGAHGTACAGIAAAPQNNNLGVSGVAPNCGLVSISHNLNFGPDLEPGVARGINWAWQNGVAVVSNSYGWYGAPSAAIDNAIQDAFTFGRGGLGTVLCFATHNFNSLGITYPATAHPDVIAVGAASPCGERKNPMSCDGEGWGSNYGPELDVIAPGVKVPTTDMQGGAGYSGNDYAPAFNGTSAATPHVAGLAGLLISMNPCLTVKQVNNIIDRTAQKVGGYAYATTPGYPNGTWNIEVGYGLIDIDAAMRMTRQLLLQNATITVDSVFQVFGSISAGYNVNPLVPVGNFEVGTGATVDFRASTFILLAGGFVVQPGAAFSAVMMPFLDCNPWNEAVGRFAQPIVQTVETPEVAPTAAEARTANVGDWQMDVRPNPLKDVAQISYQLPQPAKVSIQLYDARMNKVRDIVAGEQKAAGTHQLDLEAQNLASGIYFLRMDAGQHQHVRKLAVMR